MELGEPATTTTFYRVVRAVPPTLEDFTSPAALGRELRDPTPERRRLWSGLSVYDSEARARRKATKVPLLGSFIAAVAIPEASDTIRAERTTSSTGHYTLWADPAELHRRVVSVVPV